MTNDKEYEGQEAAQKSWTALIIISHWHEDGKGFHLDFKDESLDLFSI